MSNMSSTVIFYASILSLMILVPTLVLMTLNYLNTLDIPTKAVDVEPTDRRISQLVTDWTLFKVPDGVTSLTITGVGGGGGGGVGGFGGTGGDVNGGAGGGGGGRGLAGTVVTKTIAVVPKEVLTIDIGLAGTAGFSTSSEAGTIVVAATAGGTTAIKRSDGTVLFAADGGAGGGTGGDGVADGGAVGAAGSPGGTAGSANAGGTGGAGGTGATIMASTSPFDTSKITPVSDPVLGYGFGGSGSDGGAGGGGALGGEPGGAPDAGQVGGGGAIYITSY